MSTGFLVDHVNEVISVNSVAYQIPPNASNEHFLRLIKEIGTVITTPGLSEFLSASQADSIVPDLLDLAVLCCIAGSKIRDDDNIVTEPSLWRTCSPLSHDSYMRSHLC